MAKKNGLRKTRRLALAGRSVGKDGAAFAAPAAAPVGLSQPARAGSCGNGCDLFRATHRVSLECPARDSYLLVLLGASALSGMGRGGRVRRVLSRGTAG